MVLKLVNLGVLVLFNKTLILFFLTGCVGMSDQLGELSNHDDTSLFCPGNRNEEGLCLGSDHDEKWDFTTASDYSYNENFVEVSSGRAALKKIDLSFSGSDFEEGTHVGTSLSNNKLEMKTKLTDDETHVGNILPGKKDLLLGYWRFDSGWDDSGPHNIITTSSVGSSILSDSIIGSGASEYDGLGSTYTRIDNISSYFTDLTKGSISLWVNRGGTSGWLLSLLADSDNYIRLAFNDSENGLRMIYKAGGSFKYTVIDFSHIPLGAWSYIVYTWDKSATDQLKLYINGELVSTFNGIANIQGSITDGRIGSYFEGKVDEASIWSEALSDSDVFELYRKQKKNFTDLSSDWTPKWDSIVGYWKMDGNWKDSTINSNHGVAKNNNGTNDNLPIFSSDSKVGNYAGAFDDDTAFQYVEIPNSATLENVQENSYSFQAWYYPNDLPNNTVTRNASHGIIVKTGYHNGLCYQSNGRFSYHWWDSLGASQTISTSEKYPPGEYYHIVGVTNYEEGSLNLYINGKLAITKDITGKNIREYNTSAFKIGSAGNSLSDSVASYYADGKVDDVAIWSKPLNKEEVLDIYNRQKQKYAASYESQVIDLASLQDISNLSKTTDLPFMKELTKSSESSSDYSSLSGDLSNGLVGYWTLNEITGNSVNDLSSYDNIGKTDNYSFPAQVNTVSKAHQGVLENSFSFDGSSSFISIPYSISLESAKNDFTFSTWVSPLSNSLKSVFRLGSDIVGGGWGFNLTCSISACRVLLVTTSPIVQSNLSLVNFVENKKWHHVLFTRNGTVATLYIDGVPQVTPDTIVSTPIRYNNESFFATNVNSVGFSNFYEGKIDETGIWNRSLSASEIQQLYRRGANRVKYQVRTCSDETCSDDPEWKGPGGDGTTYFSELYNRSSADITNMFSSCDGIGDDLCSDGEFSLTGSTKENAFEFNFIDSLINNYNALTARYFQYRILMEAEDNTACDGEPCLPSVSSISFETSNEYYDSSPSVTTVSPVNIVSTILRVEEEVSGGCSVKYQFSKDGSDFYYYDSKWIEASDSVSEANTASEISTKLRNFITSGELYMRAYLISDGSQACELRSFSVIQ